MNAVTYYGHGVYCYRCQEVYEDTDECDHDLSEKDGVEMTEDGYQTAPSDMSHHSPCLFVEIDGFDTCPECGRVKLPDDLVDGSGDDREIATDGGSPPDDTEQPPDTINSFVVTGDFGFHHVEGPFDVEKGGTKWTVAIPEERYQDGGLGHLNHTEGEGCVLLADCDVVGGGLVDTIALPDGEDEIHFVVNQYARGISP